MRLFPLLLVSALLSGCGSIRNWQALAAEKKAKEAAAKDGKDKDAKPKPRAVGTVHSVHAHRNFVLIETLPGTALPEGSLLEVRSASGVSATLRTTPEHKGPLAIADIESGSPVAGQWILTTAPKAGAPAHSPLTPDAQVAAGTGTPLPGPVEFTGQSIPLDALPQTTLGDPGMAVPFAADGAPLPKEFSPGTPSLPDEPAPSGDPPPIDEVRPDVPDEMPQFRR